MASQSLLQCFRQRYQPPLPPILQDLDEVCFIEKNGYFPPSDPEIKVLFPHTTGQPLLTLGKGKQIPAKPLKVGVVLSGGPAPGGHNVISGLLDALKKLHPSSQLIGFLEGPSGLIKNQSLLLTEEIVAPYRNQGGFDIIGTGRTKIETAEQYQAFEQTLKEQALDGLVIVGGDDSNTNAAFLAEFCRKRGLGTKIIGVPKTIDGDLKNDFIEISFGFDSACKIYSETIGNLLKDALSQKKYTFFVKMMGRSASHVTLECALKTQVNLALIGEEVARQGHTLKEIVAQVADLICDRADHEKHYGVILVPEGLLEFIPECQQMIAELNRLLASDSSFIKQLEQESTQEGHLSIVRRNLSQPAADSFAAFPEKIQKQLLLDRDSHGNVQVSKIETESLLIALVERELTLRRQQGHYKGKFNPQPLFCGYEGRSGLPSNFDCRYCYALGHAAALLVFQGMTGYICCIKNLDHSIEAWEVLAVPIVEMLHFETRKNKKQAVIEKALVDLEGPVFTLFKQQREFWRLGDHYCCPGPMQFDGPPELTDAPPKTLLYEKHRDSK